MGQERADSGKFFVLSEVNIIAIYHHVVSNLFDMKKADFTFCYRIARKLVSRMRFLCAQHEISRCQILL